MNNQEPVNNDSVHVNEETEMEETGCEICGHDERFI